MKIFLSWSGNRSKEVATLLSEWLPRVIQSARPWISSRDIEKGSLWSEVIGEQLGKIATGIICLTKDNKEKPWISFEAGALAKGISTNRVCTFLIDLEPSDVQGPLAQFNHTSARKKEDIVYLLQALNDRLEENKLTPSILENALEVHWDDFETRLNGILEETPAEEQVPERSDGDILKEILENTRSLNKRVSDLESRGSKVLQVKPRSITIEKYIESAGNFNKAKEAIIDMKNKGVKDKDIIDNLIGILPDVSVPALMHMKNRICRDIEVDDIL
ncbi:TIR domain-containing protein [Acetobacter sp.]|uniref:TIR domain-containing protein n=1 Tax=Acetobacter sp. TaxID=440 RepID=UPI0039E8AEB4